MKKNHTAHNNSGISTAKNSPDAILDQLLASYGQPAPDLADRICQACAEDGRRRHVQWRAIWNMTRHAAALIIVAGLSSYFTLRQYNNANSLPCQQETQKIVFIPTANAVAEDAQGFSLQDSLKLTNDSNGNAVTNIQRVGTSAEKIAGVTANDNRKMAMMPPPPHGHAKRQPPKEISHVWVVDKKTDILSVLPKGAVQMGQSDEYGMLTYSITLSPKALGDLVTTLHDKQQWKLLSNQPPQPCMKGPKPPDEMQPQDVSYILKIIPQ